MSGISKRFGATPALEGVSLDARAGEVLALIGENGAGKSTLMKILSGAVSPDAGSMELIGKTYRPSGPHAARKAGVAIIYQELNLAPDLSVEDNVMLGIEDSRLGWLDRRRQRQRIEQAFQILGHPELASHQNVGKLSIGSQQLVEIARALVADAKIVVFDEPTSSLTNRDVERLFATIGRLQKQGLAIIYISHFLEEIRSLAQRFLVLRDGKPVGRGNLKEVSDEEIVSLMVGRSVETLFPKVEHAIGDFVLDVQGLSAFTDAQRVNFKVRRGEIFGLFGLVGAGRTETVRQIYGLDKVVDDDTDRTRVLVDEQRSKHNPKARMSLGFGFLSEDRKNEGLAQSMSIADNLTLSHLKPYRRFGLIDLKRRREETQRWMQRLRIKARNPDQTVTELSGGNQQKVAFARVLHQAAEILLLDEPTRGIDVGTKAEIYRLIGELAAAGRSIIFVSSYLPELVAICDTIGVMSRGKLVGVRPVAKWTEGELMSHAIDT